MLDVTCPGSVENFILLPTKLRKTFLKIIIIPSVALIAWKFAPFSVFGGVKCPNKLKCECFFIHTGM